MGPGETSGRNESMRIGFEALGVRVRQLKPSEHQYSNGEFSSGTANRVIEFFKTASGLGRMLA